MLGLAFSTFFMIILTILLIIFIVLILYLWKKTSVSGMGMIAIVIGVFLLLIVGIILFNASGPVSSMISKNKLSQVNPLLSKMECSNDCRYIGPSTFLVTQNPLFECKCDQYLDSESVEGAINAIDSLFLSQNWRPSTYNTNNVIETTYFKDAMRFHAQYMYWKAKNNQSRILVTLEHCKFIDYNAECY